MGIAVIIQIVAALFVVTAALVSLYYSGLAIVSLICRNNSPNQYGQVKTSFAIVIPAHNEESILGDTLRSCASLDYPPEKLSIYVVADNCTDSTGNLARNMGAVCLERNDPNCWGKGHALAWALPQVLVRGHDAVLILDADTTIYPDAIRVLDERIQAGERVLQACYMVSNPDASPITYALAVGNLLENGFFYYPKSCLGLAVFLRGTGMAFHRSVLEAYPWRAGSQVEDVEYSLELLSRGIPVSFVQKVKVISPFPVLDQQIIVQRERWSGGLRIGRSKSVPLLICGFLKGNIRLVDAGWTLLVMSRPLVIGELLIALIASGIAAATVPGILSSYLMIIAIGSFFVQIVYLAIGVFSLGITQRRLLFLLKAPFVVTKLFVIAMRGFIGVADTNWIKTPRI